MLNRANIPAGDRYDLLNYATVTATKLDMLSVVEIDGVRAMTYLHWSDTVPKFAKKLRTWGEAGTVTLKTDFTPKPKDRGVHCMFVGYFLMHDGDCCQMKNIDTSRVYDTRDVVWLQRIYHVKPEGQLSANIIAIPEIEDIDVSSMETEDDLSDFEIVEETKLIEEVEKTVAGTTEKC